VNPGTKEISKSSYDYLALFLLALIPRFFFLTRKMMLPGGLPKAFDSKVFLEQARDFAYHGYVQLDLNGIFYVSYYSILGIFLRLFHSTLAFVIMQMLINALTVILVYKLGIEIFDRKAAIISGIIYSFLFPLIHWSIFITTDSLFVTLMLLQAYLSVRCIKYNKRSSWIKLLLISIYMIFFRPTGIITLAFTAIYLLINLNIKGFVLKHRRVFLSALGILIVLIAVTANKIFSHPVLKSFEANLYWLLTEVYTNGQMYDVRSSHDYIFNAKVPPGNDFLFALNYFKNNFTDIMILYFRRIITFAGVWVWKFHDLTVIRRTVYIAFSSMVFILLVIGIIDMFRKRIMKRASIVLFMIASIMIFTIFFFMDSAYRYRVPALAFAIYPVAQGIGAVIELVRVKLFKGEI